MKNLIFTLIFSGFLSASTPASASNLVPPNPTLKLDQYSGFVIPQAAREEHCTLTVNTTSTNALTGTVSSEIFSDRSGAPAGTWNHHIVFSKIVSDLDLAQIQTWIGEAASGPFQQGVNPCDIGTFNIVTSDYPLILSQDCGAKVTNLNPAASKLVAWFQQACQSDSTSDETPLKGFTP